MAVLLTVSQVSSCSSATAVVTWTLTMVPFVCCTWQVRLFPHGGVASAGHNSVPRRE